VATTKSSTDAAGLASWKLLRAGLVAASDRIGALQLISRATGYAPLEPQKDLHIAHNPDRIDKFFCAGIGSGKSTAAVVDDVICAILNPGCRGLIVAPTYDQCLHVLLPRFLAICEAMEKRGMPLLKRMRWSQMRAELMCGGEVFFRSTAKVDNLLGFEFAWIHFDETETVANPELIWDTLSGRLRQEANFRQMLGTSTPRGLRGVIGKFHLAREDYKTPEEREALRRRFVFVRSTSLDNPHLPPDYLETLRRTLSKAAWDQEVMAKILRPEAAVYPEFERARHEFKIASKAEFLKRLRELGVSYDLAYDFGPNYSHVLWIARFAEMDVIFDELCDDGITTDRLHDEIIKRCLALGRPPEWIVCDRAVKRERAWAAEAFPQTSVMVMDARHEQSILEGIAVIKNLLDPAIGEPRLRFCSYLWDRTPRRGIVKCFAQYVYQRQSNGMLSRLPWKDNTHDHGVDCARYWAMKRFGEAYRYAVVQRRHSA
jgi:hypothetical protein